MSEPFENNGNPSGDAVTRKTHQCPFCKDILQDDYIKMHPFSEIPCPSCGSLIEMTKSVAVLPSRNERRDRRCNITLKVAYKSFDRFITEYTNNVSQGGMFIHTQETHAVGDTMEVMLEVPNLEEPVRIIAEVVHTRYAEVSDEKMGVGVKFINIDEISRKQLIDFLRTWDDCG